MLKALRSEVLFFRAQVLSNKGQTDKAIRIYERALTWRPFSAVLRLQFGLTLAEKFDYNRAETEIRRAIELEPINPVMPMFLGRILLEQGNYQKALESLDASLILAPQNPQCLSLKGLALLQAGETSKGLELLSQYFTFRNEWLEALILLYCERLCLGQRSNSVEILETFPVELPKKPGTLHVVLSSIGKPLSILADFIDYLSTLFFMFVTWIRSPQEAKFRRRLVHATRSMSINQIERARVELKACASMDVALKDQYILTLCSLLYEIGELKITDQLLGKYLKSKSGPPQLCLIKAKVAMRLGNFKDAQIILEKLNGESGKDGLPGFLKGICALQNGDIFNAMQYFREASKSAVPNLARVRLFQTFHI